jgi:hypothetical protein
MSRQCGTRDTLLLGLKRTQVISFAMEFAHLGVDVSTPQLATRKCYFADVRIRIPGSYRHGDLLKMR